MIHIVKMYTNLMLGLVENKLDASGVKAVGALDGEGNNITQADLKKGMEGNLKKETREVFTMIKDNNFLPKLNSKEGLAVSELLNVINNTKKQTKQLQEDLHGNNDDSDGVLDYASMASSKKPETNKSSAANKKRMQAIQSDLKRLMPVTKENLPERKALLEEYNALQSGGKKVDESNQTNKVVIDSHETAYQDEGLRVSRLDTVAFNEFMLRLSDHLQKGSLEIKGKEIKSFQDMQNLNTKELNQVLNKMGYYDNRDFFTRLFTGSFGNNAEVESLKRKIDNLLKLQKGGNHEDYIYDMDRNGNISTVMSYLVTEARMTDETVKPEQLSTVLGNLGFNMNDVKSDGAFPTRFKRRLHTVLGTGMDFSVLLVKGGVQKWNNQLKRNPENYKSAIAKTVEKDIEAHHKTALLKKIKASGSVPNDKNYQIGKKALVTLVVGHYKSLSVSKNISGITGGLLDSMNFVPSKDGLKGFSVNKELFNKKVLGLNLSGGFSLPGGGYVDLSKTVDFGRMQFSYGTDLVSGTIHAGIKESASSNTAGFNKYLVSTQRAAYNFFKINAVDGTTAQKLAGRKLNSSELATLQSNFKEFKRQQKIFVDNGKMNGGTFVKSYLAGLKAEGSKQIEGLRITGIGAFLLKNGVSGVGPIGEINTRELKAEANQSDELNKEISKRSVAQLIEEDDHLKKNVTISGSKITIKGMKVDVLGDVKKNGNTYVPAKGQRLKMDIVRDYQSGDKTTKTFSILISSEKALTSGGGRTVKKIENRVKLGAVITNADLLNKLNAVAASVTGSSRNAQGVEKFINPKNSLDVRWKGLLQAASSNKALGQLVNEYDNPKAATKEKILAKVQAMYSTSYGANFLDKKLGLSQIVTTDRKRSGAFDKIISKELGGDFSLTGERSRLYSRIESATQRKTSAVPKSMGFDVKSTLIKGRAVNKGLAFIPGNPLVIADNNGQPILEKIVSQALQQKLLHKAAGLSKMNYNTLKDALDKGTITISLGKDPYGFDDIPVIQGEIVTESVKYTDKPLITNDNVTGTGKSAGDRIGIEYGSWGGAIYDTTFEQEEIVQTSTETTTPNTGGNGPLDSNATTNPNTGGTDAHGQPLGGVNNTPGTEISGMDNPNPTEVGLGDNSPANIDDTLNVEQTGVEGPALGDLTDDQLNSLLN